MTEQSDNTNFESNKKNPFSFISERTSQLKPKLAQEKRLQVRNFPDRERPKDNDTYKMTMIKSMNSALGSDKKVN